MKQRGFILPSWGYLVLAIAALVMVYAVFQFVDAHWETSAGVKKGEAAKQAEWDAANRKAEEDEKQRQAAITAALLEEQQRADAAERRADDSDTQWREAQRDAERKGIPLSVCESAPVSDADRGDGRPSGSGLRAPAVGDRPPSGGVRITWLGVRLVDAAWTGADGKPVFAAPAGPEGSAGAGAASPYGLDDLVEVHGINAQRCSADRRNYGTLMSRIRAAEAAWGRDAAVK